MHGMQHNKMDHGYQALLTPAPVTPKQESYNFVLLFLPMRATTVRDSQCGRAALRVVCGQPVITDRTDRHSKD